MKSYFCITLRFLDPYSHGRGETGDPEWPLSPLRVFQALVAASAGRWNERREIKHALPALRWLESQPVPEIMAPPATPSDVKCLHYVPDNSADLLVPAWRRGDLVRQVSRTEKVVRPAKLEGNAVRLIYSLSNGDCPHADVLAIAARNITHVGWGIDAVVGDAAVISADEAAKFDGHRWRPTAVGGTSLRVPVAGTMCDLARKHEEFLTRLSSERFRPVSPLKVFHVQAYRRDDQPAARKWRAFELRDADGKRFRHPHRRLIHIAGMVRHLAIAAMRKSPPTGVANDWVETHVAGHASAGASVHSQFSYLPLPSVGSPHSDPGVRRVLISSPSGDDASLAHLARRLAGQMLVAEHGNEFSGRAAPLLVPLLQDGVTKRYTCESNAWASVTPVILPGHDDHRPDKTRRLIERALRQSGIELPCEFEWGPFSRFPKMLPAFKYDKDKRPTGYIRPDHLLSQTAVHLTLRFNDGLKVPGPMTIGAGRHCGFGLMAACDDN